MIALAALKFAQNIGEGAFGSDNNKLSAIRVFTGGGVYRALIGYVFGDNVGTQTLDRKCGFDNIQAV
jgi:hypothetical protein